MMELHEQHLHRRVRQLFDSLTEMVEIYKDEDCSEKDQPKCIRRAFAALEGREFAE